MEEDFKQSFTNMGWQISCLWILQIFLQLVDFADGKFENFCGWRISQMANFGNYRVGGYGK